MRRYLALWPSQIGRAYRLLEMVGEGSLVMVQSIFSLLVLLRLVLGGILQLWLGLGLVYTCFAIWLALFSISRQLFLMLGVTRLQRIFVVERVFAVGRCWIYLAPCSSLILLMLEKEMRLCFVVSWLVVSGMVFSLVGSGSSLFLVGFVVPQMVMVIFWECSFPPLVEIRENPEFHDLMREDGAHWPRCLLWHGWLPMLSVVNGASPWAADASESALQLVEIALGCYSSGLVAEWSLPDGFVADEVAARMPDARVRFGLMVVWSWIRSLVFLLLVLVCLLTRLNTAGVTAGGVMLIVFSWIACLNLAGVSCLSLDLCRLFRGLSWEEGGHFSCAVI